MWKMKSRHWELNSAPTEDEPDTAAKSPSRMIRNYSVFESFKDSAAQE